jgi:magnesium transporter
MIKMFTANGNVLKEIKCEAENLASCLPSALWVDVLTPTDEERSILTDFLKADVPEEEDYEEIEDSARCFVDQLGIHVNSLFLMSKDGMHETMSVACILQANRLITIREEQVSDFRLFRMRAKRGQVNCSSPSELLVSLLEQKVENIADILENIHKDLEKIGRPVLTEKFGKPEDIVSDLALAEDSNGKARLCLTDTQRDISFLQRNLKGSVDLHETCKDTMKDIDTLMSHTTFLFDKINFLMDFMQGLINIQQNQIIKIFSIASVIFLPPTLVASIYGMNFDFMPELKWPVGYPFSIFLMIFSAVSPYFYFKRKGWL